MEVKLPYYKRKHRVVTIPGSKVNVEAFKRFGFTIVTLIYGPKSVRVIYR